MSLRAGAVSSSILHLCLAGVQRVLPGLQRSAGPRRRPEPGSGHGVTVTAGLACGLHRTMTRRPRRTFRYRGGVVRYRGWVLLRQAPWLYCGESADHARFRAASQRQARPGENAPAAVGATGWRDRAAQQTWCSAECGATARPSSPCPGSPAQRAGRRIGRRPGVRGRRIGRGPTGAVSLEPTGAVPLEPTGAVPPGIAFRAPRASG